MAELDNHINECALRYQALEHRLETMEEKLDKVYNTVEDFKNQIVLWSVRAIIGLVLFIAGAVFVIKI
jgi:hypothetical protein